MSGMVKVALVEYDGGYALVKDEVGEIEPGDRMELEHLGRRGCVGTVVGASYAAEDDALLVMLQKVVEEVEKIQAVWRRMPYGDQEEAPQ